MRKCVSLFIALTLASCAAEQNARDAAALTESEDLLKLVDNARTAMRAGNLELAGRLYDDAIALEPGNPGLWVDIARFRFQGGEHLTAIEAADYALELGPTYAPALLLRAQMVRDAHGLAEALPWFVATIEADPRNTEALGEYAATLGDLGRYKDMLKAVRELAAIEPEDPTVHYLQAVLAARAGDPVLAGSLLARSGMSDDGVTSAMMLDAIINLQQGTYGTAANILEELAERQPGNMRVSELLVKALWLGGRDREIVDRFEVSARDDAESPYLVMLVARSLERMGERERAIPLLERARRVKHGEALVLSPRLSLSSEAQQLRSAAQVENDDEVDRLSNVVLQRFPESADAHLLAGDAALFLGEAERSGALYAISARVRRAWPLTRKLIETYRLTGADDAPDALLLRTIAGDPQNIDALVLLAKRSATSADWLRADVLLETVMKLGAGNDLEVLRLRADAARALGLRDDARRLETMRQNLSPGEFTSG